MKNAIWLTGYQVLDELNEDGVQRFLVECMTFVDACSRCGVVGRLYKHGSEQPAFRDIPSFGRQLIIDVKQQRYRCRECGGTTNQLPTREQPHDFTRPIFRLLADTLVLPPQTQLHRQ